MPAPNRPGHDGIAAAVVAAAGRGVRFGAPDKVFLPLAGRPLLAHVLDAFEAAHAIRDVILVVGEHTRATADDLVLEGPWTKVLTIVTGGERRQDSVAAGLAAVTPDTPFVAVHDGARPLVSPALIDACVAAAVDAGAAIAAVPVADTLKRVAGGRIVETVPRHGLWAAQTPQACRVDLLRAAFDLAAARGLEATDEAALLEAAGHPVAIVRASTTNLKITHPEDLTIAEALLAHGGGGELAP